MVGYGPIEGNNFVDSIGYSNMYRLYVLRDLNGWVGDNMRMGMTGVFGVPGENDNGRVVDFCVQMRLCVGNIC